MGFDSLPDPTPTETILLVDDETGIRTMFTRVLRAAGYNVIAARNGADAIDALRAYDAPVHLVITDIVMPKLSGTELFAMLHRWYPRLRVLIISGFDGGAVAASTLVDVETQFLPKPFGPEELLARVRALLDDGR